MDSNECLNDSNRVVVSFIGGRTVVLILRFFVKNVCPSNKSVCDFICDNKNSKLNQLMLRGLISKVGKKLGFIIRIGFLVRNSKRNPNEE